MNTTLRIFAIGLVAFLTNVTRLNAQSPVGTPRGDTVVAVLDLARVFKSHPRFKREMDAIKADIEAFEKDVNRQRENLMAQGQDLPRLGPGSPEYKRTEAELAQRVSDLQVSAKLKQREILDREARVYYDTYVEVTKLVSRIADQYGISLVMRYDSDEINRDDRSEVLKGINRDVVFQRNRDLTQLVIDSFNPPETARATVPGGPERR